MRKELAFESSKESANETRIQQRNSQAVYYLRRHGRPPEQVRLGLRSLCSLPSQATDRYSSECLCLALWLSLGSISWPGGRRVPESRQGDKWTDGGERERERSWGRVGGGVWCGALSVSGSIGAVSSMRNEPRRQGERIYRAVAGGRAGARHDPARRTQPSQQSLSRTRDLWWWWWWATGDRDWNAEAASASAAG